MSDPMPFSTRIRPYLYLTVGLPRSGKSTWARSTALPIVSPDAIRIAIHGTAFRKEAEPLVWATAKIMVASLFEAGHPKVILDATNITRARRDDWIDARWDREFVLFQAHERTCIERLDASNAEELTPVIWRMSDALEWPTAAELREGDRIGATFEDGRP